MIRNDANRIERTESRQGQRRETARVILSTCLPTQTGTKACRQSRDQDSMRRTTKLRRLDQSGSHHGIFVEDERAARVARMNGGSVSSFYFRRSSRTGA